MPFEALALARALTRAPARPAVAAFVGWVEPARVLAVLRWVRAPEGGGVVMLISTPQAALQAWGPAFARRGWSARGLGLGADEWLEGATGTRVDALVAWHALGTRDEAGRREFLERAARRTGLFVALEAPGRIGEGGLTALWPAWHSCALRERRRAWHGHLFEARPL